MLESQGHDKVPNLYWIPGTCENVIDATMESKDQQKGIRVSYTFRRQPQSRPITAWSSGSVKSTPIWLAASGTGIQPNVYISCFLPSHHWTQKKELKDFRFSQNAFAPWEPLSLLESHRKIGKTCLAVCCLLIWFTIVLQFPGRFRRLLLGLCLLVSYPPSDSSKHHRGRIIPIYIKQKKHIGTSFLLVGSCHVATFVISCYFCCCHFSVIVAGWCWCCPTFAFLSCRFSARGFEALVTLGPGGAACQGFPSGPMRGQCNWLSTL